MKRFILGVTIGVLSLGSAMADRPVFLEQKTQDDNADYEYVTLTGSHLKQRVLKRNIITVGNRSGSVLTIDQREMQRNGGSTIGEQLSHYPGIQIGR
jgi:outer membrane receptor for Fe3+-dicitrate